MMNAAQDKADIASPRNAKVCIARRIRVCAKAYRVMVFTEPSEFRRSSLYTKNSKLATDTRSATVINTSMDVTL